MRWAEHIVQMGAWRGADGVLVGKADGKRPLRHRWEDNIKMGFQEVG